LDRSTTRALRGPLDPAFLKCMSNSRAGIGQETSPSAAALLSLALARAPSAEWRAGSKFLFQETPARDWSLGVTLLLGYSDSLLVWHALSIPQTGLILYSTSCLCG
jgi:hypothetical protein